MKLRDYLQSKTKENLVKEILELHSLVPEVRDYYSVVLGDSGETINKYKKIIKDEYFPARGEGEARASVARNAINAFSKLITSDEALIDLLLFHVEQGVKYTNEYGDINEAFYDSIESSYDRALRQIRKHKLHGLFQKRCQKIVADAEGIGWGFGDYLSDRYCETFEE